MQVGEESCPNSILCINAKSLVLQKNRILLLRGAFRKRQKKRRFVRSEIHFGRLPPAPRRRGRGLGRGSSFIPAFKRKVFLDAMDENIHHRCLLSFGRVRGQLPAVDGEQSSEQNTFIIKYYLAKIFTMG